jgi:hypothetical protein
VSIA